MEMNYFVALICEVKWWLCGIAGCSSLLLVSDNFFCSHRLSEDFGENTTHLTAQCTVPKFQDKWVFYNCRTWLCSWKYQDNILWPSRLCRYHPSLPVFLVLFIWNLLFNFSNLNQQIWIKIPCNKKEFFSTKMKYAFIKGTLRSLETSKMNLRQRMIDLY